MTNSGCCVQFAPTDMLTDRAAGLRDPPSNLGSSLDPGEIAVPVAWSWPGQGACSCRRLQALGDGGEGTGSAQRPRSTGCASWLRLSAVTPKDLSLPAPGTSLSGVASPLPLLHPSSQPLLSHDSSLSRQGSATALRKAATQGPLA